jgi:hypothetical protein
MLVFTLKSYSLLVQHPSRRTTPYRLSVSGYFVCLEIASITNPGGIRIGLQAFVVFLDKSLNTIKRNTDKTLMELGKEFLQVVSHSTHPSCAPTYSVPHSSMPVR